MAIAMSFAADASAQAAQLPIARNTATIGVIPAVADVGTLREIRISGRWTDGCVPVSAAATQSTVGGQPVVTIQLQIPLTLIACTQAITSYTQAVNFTPGQRGKHRVVVVTSAGQYLGEGVVDVRQPNDDRSRHDITGLWYDPGSNGSGLTFIHSKSTDSLVFGTWYVYGADGVARWFTIQNTRWTLQGEVLEGDLYETRSAATACAPLTACPALFTSATIIGRARMGMTGADTARIEAISPAGQGGAVLFASNIQRINF
ncbi:MAG: hypothetical protein JNJ55_11030 [Betaproteobacteria bacterium]|nr:hypothetical protein [Betaproteobacteria bacterium]